MLKYNPFNQELENAIDGIKQQIAQLRNDMEFLSAAAQRADDRFGGGGGGPNIQHHIAIPVKLFEVTSAEAKGQRQLGLPEEDTGYEWLRGIPLEIFAKNVLNSADSPPGAIYHNLSTESERALIAKADKETLSGGIFHLVLQPGGSFGDAGYFVPASYAVIYDVTRNTDTDEITWSKRGDPPGPDPVPEETFAPPEGQPQQSSQSIGGYGTPRAIPISPTEYGPSRRVVNGRVMLDGDEDKEEDEENWVVQVFTYCKPDIEVICLEDIEEPEPEP